MIPITRGLSDALLAQILKQLGAIIIAKTNLPQSILVSPDAYIDLIQESILTNRSGARLITRSGD